MFFGLAHSLVWNWICSLLRNCHSKFRMILNLQFFVMIRINTKAEKYGLKTRKNRPSFIWLIFLFTCFIVGCIYAVQSKSYSMIIVIKIIKTKG